MSLDPWKVYKIQLATSKQRYLIYLYANKTVIGPLSILRNKSDSFIGFFLKCFRIVRCVSSSPDAMFNLIIENIIIGVTGALNRGENSDSIHSINTLRPGQHGRHFADDIFTCIFINENFCILIKFSLKYVRKDPIDNNPALVQIMAWRRHYLNQWWLIYRRIYASLGLNELSLSLPCCRLGMAKGPFY